MSRTYPAIPEPSTSPESVRATVVAMKEAVEIMVGQRGAKLTSVVTFQDLIDMALILEDEIPT